MEEGYYKTKESVEEYVKLSEGFNGALLIEKFKKVLNINSNVLEIGSGPGTDWNILSKYYNVTGSDNSPEFINHLTSKNPNGNFLELDASTLSINGKFDGIYSNKVLHHLNDNELANSIKRQYEILNTNGVICHSFWLGEGSEVFKGLFVNYHTVSNLQEVFSKQFDIISIEKYKEFENDDSLLLIGKKKAN